MCAPQYNTCELSDRVLVFDIMSDDWETATILNSVTATEADDEMPASVSLENSSIKRSLEETEEPQLKRIKTSTEKQDMKSFEMTAQYESGNQNESGNFQECEQAENEIQELACEQAENKQIGSPSSQELPGEKSASPYPPSSIQRRDPLRQHKIYIHSLWLSVQSTYFRSLLHSSGMKETHDAEVHIKIPESEENAHLNLLEAMYHGDILNDKTVDELLAVLELADKYDVKFVFKICKYILQKNATTFGISTKIMHVIKVKHNMNDVEDLAETLQLVLARAFSPLDQNWQSKKFANLSEPSLKYLLSSNDLIVVSENTVFHALMHWIEQNAVDPGSLEETNDLLSVVRFKLITIDYLYNVIKNHPIATKMPQFNQLFLDGMIYHAIPSEQKKMLREQPVQRKKSEGKVFVHTYLLNKERFYGLNEKLVANLHLEAFWACGYKMSIILIKAENNRYYYPHLTIHNLNLESLIPLKCLVVETKTSSSNLQEETFTLFSCRKKFTLPISPKDFNTLQTCTLHVAVAPL
ncbi:BTB POZ domain-containing POB1 [Paramuricea clavata]|uniref:BTB POZ domain-containing POB1 n=1 Tax=Paramuricea clavata TaxID=317549 RepID=A0A6S7KHA8_PARCT|nr:BTB POZ domain-containing POB1 [Paramuricea clavata]